eukprot:11788522-Alexandrium_andersonii.AAC.1
MDNRVATRPGAATDARSGEGARKACQWREAQRTEQHRWMTASSPGTQTTINQVATAEAAARPK